MIVLCVIGGCACLAFAFVPDIRIALPVLAVLGVCTVLPLAMTNTAIQVMTPEEMRGRVLSIRVMITFGLAPFGSLLAGWVAQVVGAQLTLALSGALCTLIALLIAVIHVQRRIEFS